MSSFEGLSEDDVTEAVEELMEMGLVESFVDDRGDTRYRSTKTSNGKLPEFGIGSGEPDTDTMQITVTRGEGNNGGPYPSLEAMEGLRDEMLKFVGKRLLARHASDDDPIEEFTVRIQVSVNGETR